MTKHKVKVSTKAKSNKASREDDEVSYSAKEKKQALTIMCDKCARFAGKPCRNTKTGEDRKVPHTVRVEMAIKLSKNPTAKAAAVVAESVKAKKNPKEKLTPEQKTVVDTIQDKWSALAMNADFTGPVTVGPLISTFRFFPDRRTKVASLENSARDLAVALGAEAVLVKRMPGESAVGVTVPNKERKVITFEETIGHVRSYFEKNPDSIPLNFGQTADGEPYVDNLTEMPHLLIAGATGSGKSTQLHAIVASIIFCMDPKQIKLCIGDTKGVEFSHMKGVPHLKFPVAENLFQAMEQLQWGYDETERRLKQNFQWKGVRNIHEYNAMVPDDQKLPYIVYVFDELADILGPHLGQGEAKLNANKLNALVARSRASGIYVIAGTQRPDVKMVAGSIKANFPARLSFRMSSSIDSKTIINTKGAENLLGKGDMLFLSPTQHGNLKRLHAPYTSIQDIRNTVTYVLTRKNMQEKNATQEVRSTEGRFRVN